MWELLQTWRPGEVIALVGTAGGLFVGLMAILGGYWYALVRQKRDFELRYEMVRRGMTAEDIERAMKAFGAATVASKAAAAADTEADGELAQALMSAHVPAEGVEQALRDFRAVPAADKRAILDAVWGMISYEPNAGALLAAIRGLCSAREPGAHERPETAEPASDLASLPLQVRN